METAAQYKHVISELIHKQIIILGPDITLARIKNIEGLQVSSTGEVISINGDPESIMQSIINRFVDLSGMIVRKTMESIIASYQGLSDIQKSVGVSVPSSMPQPESSPIPVVHADGYNSASTIANKADQMTQMKELNTLIQGINEPKVGAIDG